MASKFKGDEFCYLRINDIHFLHGRTPTDHIGKNFEEQVLTEENQKLDAMFFAGDIFDKLGDPSSPEYLMTVLLLANVLDFCYTHDIVLRVLEGTPLHDWKQPKIMEVLNDAREDKVDFKYISILDIEYIERFDKHVLYIPDEWSQDHDAIEKQIEKKLRELNIQQVDIAIMHGQFNYQMMGVPNPPFCYDENYFLSLVKELIHIGHFHIKSEYDRIHAGPSFDRLKHGEEDPKGYHVITGTDIKFIENKNAYTYMTFIVRPKDTLKTLDKKILSLPERSYVRLVMTSDHPFNVGFRELVLRYNQYNLTKLVKDASDSKPIANIVSEADSLISNFSDLCVNIKEVVYDNIMANNVLKPSASAKLKEALEVFNNTENKDNE